MRIKLNDRYSINVKNASPKDIPVLKRIALRKIKQLDSISLERKFKPNFGSSISGSGAFGNALKNSSKRGVEEGVRRTREDIEADLVEGEGTFGRSNVSSKARIATNSAGKPYVTGLAHTYKNEEGEEVSADADVINHRREIINGYQDRINAITKKIEGVGEPLTARGLPNSKYVPPYTATDPSGLTLEELQDYKSELEGKLTELKRKWGITDSRRLRDMPFMSSSNSLSLTNDERSMSNLAEELAILNPSEKPEEEKVLNELMDDFYDEVNQVIDFLQDSDNYIDLEDDKQILTEEISNAIQTHFETFIGTLRGGGNYQDSILMSKYRDARDAVKNIFTAVGLDRPRDFATRMYQRAAKGMRKVR
jgi:hypothetical protein